MSISYQSLEQSVGKTPLVRLTRIGGAANQARGNIILGKLEGHNPAGSVKDRPAVSMITRAEARGEIKPGDTLIEATSGNTGIALAMAAAMRGYRMVLIMPENLSLERRQSMKAFGAELILVTQALGLEGARDLADEMARQGQGTVLNQFQMMTPGWPTTKPLGLRSGRIPRAPLPTSSQRWARQGQLRGCRGF